MTVVIPQVLTHRCASVDSAVNVLCSNVCLSFVSMKTVFYTFAFVILNACQL